MAKTRSPNYPQISLAEALDKVKKIYKAEHLHSASDEVIAKTLGYTGLNGRSMGVISAIKKYGLLVPEGAGYRVSDDVVNIVELSPEEPERINAVKKAAFAPQLFSELHETYGDHLPSDSNLRHFLIKKKFNPNTADEVIKLYRDTLGLVTDLTPEYDGGDSDSEDVLEEKPMPPAAQQPTQQANPPQAVHHSPLPVSNGLRDFPLYLTNNQRGILHVPAEMSCKDYELLKQQVENHMAIILVTSVVKDSKEKE